MSDVAYGLAEAILEGEVKTSRAKPKDLQFIRARVSRLVRNAPEVMVKITGNSKGGAHLATHLDYITRKGKLEAEDERGSLVSGRADVAEVAEEWIEDCGKRKRNTRDSTNIILSMPPGTNANGVKNAAREFAKDTFAYNHQYLFVLHQDEKHPHVHLTVKNLGYDGTRLHVKKGDPQIWRASFAKQLRKQGIAAESTARAPRGVVRKPTRQAVLALRERGLRPKVDEAKVKAALKELSEGNQPPKPWEDKIKQRQTGMRKGWLTVAKELGKSVDPQDRKLAEDVLKFVKAMPALKTERHQIQERLAKHLLQVKSPEQTQNRTNNPGQKR